MMKTLLLIATLIGLSYQTCDPSTCLLPTCRCYNDPKAPGDLGVTEIPQIISVSFEGTINRENIAYYRLLFNDVSNPNGCPARGTFFVQDQGTDYVQVKNLSQEGHEIGVHSVDGSTPKSSTEWIDTIKKVRSELDDLIDVKNVLGVRAPQLAMGGSDEMIGIGSNNMLYDSSCTNVGYSEPGTFLWPYTFDYIPSATCDNGKSPDIMFTGKWEVMVADLHDLGSDKLPCAVPSSCRNITTKRNAFDLFFTAFEEHYTSNRAPFNMVIDPAWAADQNKRDGTIEFLQYVRAAFGKDVWIVPILKQLEWVRNPTPIVNISSFDPWNCNFAMQHDAPLLFEAEDVY
ncbi:hypothetical protein ACF0H5_011819 [Mactra antiquata]